MTKAAVLQLFASLSIFCALAQAQETDTLHTILTEITLVGQRETGAIHQLPEIVGTNIYAGKKSALLVLDQSHGNLVSNTMRQLMAKVPGIFIWENESSGIQINVAARGLSPNRSWEFNIRQNGVDIAADPYGYPEAYYNPQLQSVQRIEIVRGNGSLQYGPQIGGMINYILKNGSESSRPLQAEVWQTAGSNGLYNAYQAIGGKTSRLHYYAFSDYRRGDGWRANNRFNSLTGSVNLTWKATDQLDINVQFTRWNSQSQQPGGLTDGQFNSDARQSLRARNWMELDWTTAAVSADLRFNPGTRLTAKLFTILGDRESAGFFPSAGIIVPDVLNPQTGRYSNRTVDIDHYRNVGMESRLLTGFSTGTVHHHLSTGIRIFRGHTDRFRGGTGTTNFDPQFSIDREKGWSADINYGSINAAFHAEDLITLTPRLLLIPGFRLEYLSAQASGFSGRNSQGPIALVPQQRDRTFILGGIGIELLTSPDARLYFNATSAYRPVQFADLTTPPTTDVIDRNLQDAGGWNIDLGYRGRSGDRILFDASLFLLDYRNRVGTVKQQREDGSFYNYRTNIGQSRSAGLEAFTEFSLFKKASEPARHSDLRLFISTTWMNARYRSLQVSTVSNNILSTNNLRNKKVEYAPDAILRSGATAVRGKFSTTLQVSHTTGVFTDANNTVLPSANGQNGRIPAYTLLDLSADLKLNRGLSLRGGMNNLLNERYFTRRSSGYPGPGVLPGDGRTFFVTLGYRPE